MEWRQPGEANAFKLVTALSKPGQVSAVTIWPLYNTDISGSLTCDILVKGFSASCVVDTGSAVSLIREGYAVIHGIKFESVQGPRMSVVTGETFCIQENCEVAICILGFTAVGRCGVVQNFVYDVLLGMDFLTGAPLTP